MKAVVSIIMGSTSDMPVMRKAADFLNSMQIPFEINALSAHRVPEKVEEFATNAHERGIKVIIAGAGGAAHLLQCRLLVFLVVHLFLLMVGIVYYQFYKCHLVFQLQL